MTFEMPKICLLVNVYHQIAVSFQVFKRLTVLSHVAQNATNHPWNVVTGDQQLETQLAENTKSSFTHQMFPKPLFEIIF